MDTERLLAELEYTRKKEKNRKYCTGETNISLMLDSVIPKIEKLIELENGTAKESVPFDAVPKTWIGRTNYNGHVLVENDEGEFVYEDNRKTVQEFGIRPCKKCGKYPNDEGEDACLGHLGNVMNACCGHGNEKGYIQFDNGITLRGYFEIEKL